MNSFFSFRETPYNLRNFQSLHSDNNTTVKLGIETIAYRGPEIWNLIPENIRNASSFNVFKEKKKKKLEYWLVLMSNLQNIYFQRVGFIWITTSNFTYLHLSSYDNVSSSKCIQHILMFYLDCMLEVGVGGGGGGEVDFD